MPHASRKTSLVGRKEREWVDLNILIFMVGYDEVRCLRNTLMETQRQKHSDRNTATETQRTKDEQGRSSTNALLNLKRCGTRKRRSDFSRQGIDGESCTEQKPSHLWGSLQSLILFLRCSSKKRLAFRNISLNQICLPRNACGASAITVAPSAISSSCSLARNSDPRVLG